MKISRWIIGSWISMVALAYAATPPVEMLDQMAQQVRTVLESHKTELTSRPSIIHRCVKQYLLPHVDVEGMSRSVLGREVWQQASAAEKQAFSQAFAKLVIRTYSSPLAQYQGDIVRFHPIRDSSQERFVRVESDIIRPTGQNIPLTYSLILKNGEWKVYDLSVEGVSLLQSYKTQFAEALQRTNLSGLVAQMNANSTHKQAAS